MLKWRIPSKSRGKYCPHNKQAVLGSSEFFEQVGRLIPTWRLESGSPGIGLHHFWPVTPLANFHGLRNETGPLESLAKVLNSSPRFSACGILYLWNTLVEWGNWRRASPREAATWVASANVPREITAESASLADLSRRCSHGSLSTRDSPRSRVVGMAGDHENSPKARVDAPHMGPHEGRIEAWSGRAASTSTPTVGTGATSDVQKRHTRSAEVCKAVSSCSISGAVVFRCRFGSRSVLPL
jgi:hypothetical protein